MGQSTSQAGSQAPGGQAARQPGSRLRPSPSPSSPRLSVPPVFLSLSLSLSLSVSLHVSPSLPLSLCRSLTLSLSCCLAVAVCPSVRRSVCLLVLSCPGLSGLVWSALVWLSVSLSLSLSLSQLRLEACVVLTFPVLYLVSHCRVGSADRTSDGCRCRRIPGRKSMYFVQPRLEYHRQASST